MPMETGEALIDPRETFERFHKSLTEKDCISTVNFLEELYMEVFRGNQTISPQDIADIKNGKMIEAWATAAEEDIGNGHEPWHLITHPSEFEDTSTDRLPKGFQIFTGVVTVDGLDGAPVHYKVHPKLRHQSLAQFAGATGGFPPQLIENETGELKYTIFLPSLIKGFRPEVQFRREAFGSLNTNIPEIHDRAPRPHLIGMSSCTPLFRAHGIQAAAYRGFILQRDGKSMGKFGSREFTPVPGQVVSQFLDVGVTAHIGTDILGCVGNPARDDLLPGHVKYWFQNLTYFIEPPEPRLVEATIEQTRQTISSLRDPDADLRQLPVVHAAIESIYNVSSAVEYQLDPVPA